MVTGTKARKEGERDAMLPCGWHRPTVDQVLHTAPNPDTYIAFIAVVGWLILYPPLVGNLLPRLHEALPLHLAVFDGLHETVPERERERA